MMPGVFERVRKHLKGIVAPEGYYLNEHGEEVYGKLPRVKVENPIKTLMRPSAMNYLYFFVGWMAWTVDGYDFHTISLSVSNLAKYYDRGREEISTSITLTLLFRSLGAVIFGLAGDLYGRKWPMITNLVIIAALQLATAWCSTFAQFLAVRALFGIGMGGIWGLASSMGLENMPMEARGLFSGVLQQGYALGYLIAAGINMGAVPRSPHSFKLLFYIGAGITIAVALARLFFGESRQFVERKAHEKAAGTKMTGKVKVKAFTKDAKGVLKKYWKRCIYAVIMMALFNYCSHGSQDMYPTYMQEMKGFSQKDASKATMIAKSGAVIGGTICGYYSQTLGRRFTIVLACIVGACLIPLWVLPTSWGTLTAGAFLLQFMVQGAWGVVPVHLQELSPPQFRSAFPGICYQLGNMISAPAAQITSTVSEKDTVWIDGEERPNYGKTQAGMMSVIFILLAIWVASGREQLGSRFELARAAGDAEGMVEEGKAGEVEEGKSGSEESLEEDVKAGGKETK
ncbi:MFS general substrate transporter [Ascodesmis nigricans]|uniref:MFS general substrate transporter n=1 Tax=Ascodesmis nigricans TaxID=341454 RepID=A0A4S2MPH5_9PEZI|nr:MFS general substrate transporter [Ascodesmis nigricans]